MVSQNRVFINDNGAIETHFIGFQTKESLLDVRKQYETFCKQLQQSKQRICLLIDLDGVTKTDSGARVAAVGILRDLPFYKVSVFGGDIIMKSVARLIIAATNNLVAIRYFLSREEAEKWVLE